MEKNKKIIFLVFLLLAGVLSLALAAESDAPAPAVFPGKKELVDLITEDNASSDIALDGAWGTRNPFDRAAIQALPEFVEPKKPATEASSHSELVLSGTLWSGARPCAIINDQVVGVSDVVSGKTVQKIDEAGVLLSDGTRLTPSVAAGAVSEEGPADSSSEDAAGTAAAPAVPKKHINKKP